MNGCWYVGAWRVNFDAGRIKPRHRLRSRPVNVDARLLLVMSLLVRRPGKLVTVEQILEAAWPNRVVGRDSVSTAIYQLRQILGDNAQEPSYIRTEARRGYRLVATVRRARKIRFNELAIPAALVAIAFGFVLSAWSVTLQLPGEQRYLFVESLQDRTQDAVLSPLSTAIGSTLLSELIDELPGQVITRTGSEDAALSLESQLVACDLGPALVLSLLDTKSDRYLWSQAYSLNDTDAMLSETTLVEQAAQDISLAFRTL
jgi:DNA-binding winged helix-turn-helix (wHTH) protein